MTFTPPQDEELGEQLPQDSRCLEQPLDAPGCTELAWIAKCDRMAKAANSGCGLSYELFAARFSSAVDAEIVRLPEAFRSRALELAKHQGYETKEELEDAFDGCCAHGLDPYHCPVGCGDLDPLDDDDDPYDPYLDEVLMSERAAAAACAVEFVAAQAQPEPVAGTCEPKKVDSLPPTA